MSNPKILEQGKPQMRPTIQINRTVLWMLLDKCQKDYEKETPTLRSMEAVKP